VVRRLQWSSAANMSLIAFGVVVCALGEANLVYKGLIQQLVALLFEVWPSLLCLSLKGQYSMCVCVHWQAFQHVGLMIRGLVESCSRVPELQAARLTLVQILINAKGLAMNPLQSLYYVSPACLLCLSVPFGGFSIKRFGVCFCVLRLWLSWPGCPPLLI
jgi:hypothetical protein